ncbi:MAG: class F sortase, partial [Nocardioides sp.]
VLGVRPTEVGRFRLRFVVRGPASDGLLWQARGWRGHEGRTARRAGVQRGWIAQENRDWTVVSAETRVRKARPEIVTQTSHQQVTPGAALHDQVTISGLPPGYAGAATAVLHGPFEQQPGASDCSAGTEVGRVQFPVTADGTYRTPSVVAASVGFYTWMVSLPGDVDAVPVTSPCGLVPETTQVVPFTPRVRTKVSRQHALTGSSLVDTVFVAGVGATPILVRWRLHGPIAPDVSGSCRGLVWDDAPIADRGSFEASGDGTYRTRPSVVREPGCFTYSERIPRTPLTESASTEPGVPVETALVTRPVTPSVPEVPTGAAPAVEWTPRPIEGDAFMPSSRAKPRFLHRFYPGVASAASPGGPVSRLELPRIGVSAPVASVGFDRGTMAIPRDTGTVGWLATTAAAGDLIGSSVISGHVSDPQDRPGALWRLRSARPGDVVHWRSGPAVTRYVVKSVRRYPRSKGVPAELFRTDGPHTLHLVTCARKVVRGDRFHYRDNLVVTAVRVAGRS